jgi:broad specificity phosphatase PhoE
VTFAQLLDLQQRDEQLTRRGLCSELEQLIRGTAERRHDDTMVCCSIRLRTMATARSIAVASCTDVPPNLQTITTREAPQSDRWPRATRR